MDRPGVEGLLKGGGFERLEKVLVSNSFIMEISGLELTEVDHHGRNDRNGLLTFMFSIDSKHPNQ